jgi:hypothetical protein
MDYTDDTCMNTFTQGQKDRMQGVLAAMVNRSTLASSDGATPLPSVAVDSSVKIESPNVSCGTDVNPIIILTNYGTNTLTSATITYDVDGGASENYNWTGSLATGASESITLTGITSTAGNHDLNVSVSSAGDARACNNSDSVCFTLTATSGACASVANTDYLTSTESVIINDGSTDILSNLNTGKPSGYSDYTSIVTDLRRDETYDITVDINTDGNYLCVTRVWIDWNQNCSFNDPGELYELGSAQNVANGPTSNSPLSFTVPSDAVLGNTPMRVTTRYFAAANSCENDHDAEVEDYTINVLASLSVEEFGLNQIVLYPNPTTNVLNISIQDNNLPDSYSIYNMLGQTIATKQISSNADLSINSSELSNGMYFVKIIKDGASVTLPFIKE